VAGLVLAALAGVLLGLGGYTFLYAEGLSYFSNDPKGCVNCHIMREQYDGWQKASHHAFATCNDCHIPHDFVDKYWVKARNGLWHSYYFTFQNFPEPIRISSGNAKVLQDNCLACHAELVQEVHGLGSAGDASNNCVRCHADVGHGAIR
jgi:cytochrome c nitrite reductase small subunit